MRRLHELDSLRGLAALSVVINHFLNVLPAIYDRHDALRLLKYTPVRFFWAGHEAVIFFFVLSGFVLSLPFFKQDVNYVPFLAKRICRIYIPYITAVAVAMLISQVYAGQRIDSLSTWFNAVWTNPVSPKDIADHATLIGSFHNGAYNPVLWSLVQEMRISIIFPLIMWPVKRFGWSFNVILAGICSLASMGLNHILERKGIPSGDYLLTLGYIPMFVLGALLAKHRAMLTSAYASISRPARYGLLLVAVLLYTYRWWFAHQSHILHLTTIDDFFVSIAVGIMIVSALASVNISKILGSRPLVFIGETSYSIYLFHAIILVTLIHALYYIVPLWVIWLLTLGLTFVVSGLAFRFVEMPSINAGKRLASLLASPGKHHIP